MNIDYKNPFIPFSTIVRKCMKGLNGVDKLFVKI